MSCCDHKTDRMRRCDGITAPYCPPPRCEPPAAAMAMESCCCETCPPPSNNPMHKAYRWPRPVTACPPPHYSGVVCGKLPMKHQKPRCESVLLQKIVCCEKRTIPNLCTQITLDGLPTCACAPYRLEWVQQSGAQPWWTPVQTHGPDSRNHILVSVPVCCIVVDGEGNRHHAASVVQAEVSYKNGAYGKESWRNSLLIVPCIRMLGGDVCSDAPNFCIQVEIHMEIYLLRPEPCAVQQPQPLYEEMPLYPVPVCRQPYAPEAEPCCEYRNGWQQHSCHGR